MSQLQSIALWEQTKRLNIYGDEIFKISDRHNKELLLAPTQEEQITYFAKQIIDSYKSLSLSFYQINNKFRDEIRCSNGLIRTKEFLMMDAYSFSATKEEMDKEYDKFRNAFINIFNTLNIDYHIQSTDNSEVGGSSSEEFIAKTSVGNIEIGHIFKLDDIYSKKLDARFQDKDNQLKFFQMGCYGIGLTRLFQVIADQQRDSNGFNFAQSISLFDITIICDHEDKDNLNTALDEYSEQRIFVDDRDMSIAKKIKDLDLLGIRNKRIILNNLESIKNDKRTNDKRNKASSI